VVRLSLFAAALLLTGAAQAQMGGMDMGGGMNMGGQAPAAAPAGVAPAAGVLKATGKGEVTRIDEATGRLGIRHEPIPELNMATGMNMLFRIADPAMLQQVKVGDQVTFEASREGAVVTILKLSKAP